MELFDHKVVSLLLEVKPNKLVVFQQNRVEKTRQEKQLSRLNFHEELERERLGVIVDDKVLQYGCHVHWLVVGHIVDSSVLVRLVG